MSELTKIQIAIGWLKLNAIKYANKIGMLSWILAPCNT